MISILVLTKNEEQDLPGCLASVSWSDDIHVYDSLSDDKTVEIAKEFGATVTQRIFDNWSSHQNWGLKNIQFKYPWVFYIDADERMTEELIQHVTQAVQNTNSIVAYRVQRRDFYQGTWLKHVQASPYYMRLFRPEKMKYDRLVNPVSIPDGPVQDLNGYLDHYPFSKGVSHWIARHNSYSTLEAQEIQKRRLAAESFSITKALVEPDFSVRRFHQKEFFYRLPFRPLIKFVFVYFIKLGFLDGRAGFHYSVLTSFYEYMICLKEKELRQNH